MKKTSETIVFFGSGPVAAKSLELLSEHFEIELVITKPKPAHHKGNFPVLSVAETLHLPILYATDRQSLDTLMQTNPIKSRVGVLVDFGIIVSQAVIDHFPLGIVNSHFSILPEWRGADPITFAILSGQKQTGVSLMLLVAKMDEGPILAQGIYDITPDETAQSLTDYLIKLSDALLETILPKYLASEVTPQPQAAVATTLHRDLKASYSRKLTKDDGIIDWHKPAEQLEREIRAFSEWPKSHTTLGSTEVIITKAHVVTSSTYPLTSSKPGQIITWDKQLAIVTGKDMLAIDSLKPAGKSIMSAQAFLAGYKV